MKAASIAYTWMRADLIYNHQTDEQQTDEQQTNEQQTDEQQIGEQQTKEYSWLIQLLAID